MTAPVASTPAAHRSGRRRLLWFAGIAVLLIALVRVEIVTPRVHVRWAEQVTAAQQQQLEQRYHLGSGERVEGRTLRYELEDRSAGNIRALVADPAVADTAYLDRDALTAPGREVHVSWSRVQALFGPSPLGLIQVQSAVLLAMAMLLLWAARAADAGRRRLVAIAAVVMLGICALALPLRQPIRMGDSGTYTSSRQSFEMFSGVSQIRFEAHLSHAILGRLDALFGRSDSSPERSLRALSRLGTGLFLAALLLVGAVEAWSPAVVRYLGLVTLAPSALLFFGYLELGQLSLSVAAFPLVARGLRRGTRHLEAGATLAGFGAALHGFGLLSLAGFGLDALGFRRAGAAGSPPGRVEVLLRVVVCGVTAYLGWVFLYLVVLKLPLIPGHADSIPLRPLFVSQVGDRVNAAIFSAMGLRDLFVEAWTVGVPLIVVAYGVRRAYPDLVRLAALYTIPSLLFLVAFWPIQGIGVEMDLVFAAFPATYALAWVCAQDARRTTIAAIVLASAHLVFWRVVLDNVFVNSRVG